MDFGTTLKHIAPFFIPMLALMIPIVAIAINGWAKVRRNRELHESIRQIASKGQTVPPELLAQLSATDAASRRAGWGPTANLRAGLINVGVGLGLIVFFYAMRPDGWLWAVGAIPLGVGLALLLTWKLEPKPAPNAAPGSASL